MMEKNITEITKSRYIPDDKQWDFVVKHALMSRYY